MWRKLAVMLFLLVVAQTATALPRAEISQEHYSVHETLAQIAHKTATLEHSTATFDQSTAALDHDSPKVLYTLPSSNVINAGAFSVEIQTTPTYVLITEFFKVKLAAGLFKNLTNPPLIIPWFEQLSHSNNSSRLSGWKDGNALYSSQTTYHS